MLGPDDAWQRRLNTLAWAFVGLGVVLRLGAYLLNFPFWGDELMLVQNYLGSRLRRFAQAAALQQVAPVGLCGGRADGDQAVRLLGMVAAHCSPS